MNFNEILNRYAYSDDAEIIDRIKKCSGTDEKENRDIINSIVLWKINRQVDIGADLFVAIKNLNIVPSAIKTNEKDIKKIICDLLQVKGVKIAMASTILKMFYPDTFPIIDQRAYRELYSEELPTFYGKNTNQKYAELYFQYILECHTYNQKVCPNIKFDDIDKVLYQLDLEKGNKIKY
ncbi:MAG: hypothetical protein IJX16_03395 [Clostridia bacterium]|nr:hypothetical protein [Clostridia bacterium]